MGEEERRNIYHQLSKWEVSKEDLLHMLRYNTNKLLPKKLGIFDLRKICVSSHGMTYGAMESACFTCKGLLVDEGDSYFCSRSGTNERICRKDMIHYVKVSENPWQIPDTVQNISLRKWHRQGGNLILEFNQAMIDQRNFVIDKIKTHTMMDNETELYIDVEVVYSYFLVNTPDFSDKKFSICQVLKSAANVTFKSEEEEFYLKLDENIYAKPVHCIRRMKKKEAIEEFETKFLYNTHIGWEEWCSGDIEYSFTTQMLPLRIDYLRGNLNDLTDQEIDDVLSWRN
ncbi:uncharacterized protein LOC107847758 isoform X3 [Capsicum annuum]|uniref:uncharacterized protein LOC107847758 isoform X3 n=1 Tax=Capsicum annuum TaxID=4072 RepID=UPI0007BF3448|nr:uncharacterized protein LOC107847758 isoform X3 [Capsicum annuum]XP_047255735.1 uncharacterized protein LOC107847758 isoform X3 [Capsicum annuum]